jgi:hypothetical protein
MLVTATTRVYGVDPARRAKSEGPKPAAPANAEAPKDGAPTKLEVKNKSVFNMTPNSRSPFWPIGYKPTAKISQSQGDESGPEIAPSTFSVSSITLGVGKHFAIINGKIMEEGQQFGLQIGNQTYQITVKTIEDGRVILSRRDSEITVPLRRK